MKAQISAKFVADLEYFSLNCDVLKYIMMVHGTF